jgi:hypothetical protein
MADVIRFSRRGLPRYRSEPGFVVTVLEHDGLWYVVARHHSWCFRARSAAQAFAREVADGFGVPTVVQLRGAA